MNTRCPKMTLSALGQPIQRAGSQMSRQRLDSALLSGAHGAAGIPDTVEHRQVDVLMLSDLRFPGGTSHSLAEEIVAQSQVGWSTGLVHVNGPFVSSAEAG